MFLIIGIAYACAIFAISYRERDAFRAEEGNLFLLAPSEVIVFILCSFGMPDYLLHTIEGKAMGILDDKRIPPTLVASCIVPGAILAFLMLRSEQTADLLTLVILAVTVAAGSYTGSLFVSRLDGSSIRKFIIIALILSLVVIVIRIVISGGEPGTLSSIRGIRLAVIGALCFGSGFVNMFGIPMKPAWTAMFLIAGMSPISTLSAVLIVGCVSPMAGGVNVLRNGGYNMKMVFASTLFGSIGALIGISIALSLPASVLNILLIAIVLIAIGFMIRK